MKKVLLFLTCMLFSALSISQTWKGLNDSLTFYIEQKEYKKAIVVGEKALVSAKTEFGEAHINYITSLMNLASLYNKTNQYNKSEPLYILSIDIKKKILGEDHPDYAVSLNDLAVLYKAMGQYDKAEPLHILALGIWKKKRGETHPDYATGLYNLATIYQRRGQYEKAEPLYIQAVEIDRKVLGETQPDYTSSLTGLALLYKSMGQYEKAEPLYLQAMEIKKKALGDTSTSYASSLTSLAGLYISIGQYEKAEPLYSQAIWIKKKVFGETHSSYASSLHDAAVLYKTMGQYYKAETFYIQAMSIWEKTLGETHPYYATCLNNLAELYRSMGKYEKAEPIHMQALKIKKKVLGDTHPDYARGLHNLAGLYENMGLYEKAEHFYIQAKEILKKTLGETHPDYSSNLNSLALFYGRMGQYEKAEPFILQSAQIRVQNLLRIFSVLSEDEKGNYIANKTSILATSNSFVYNFRKGTSLVLQNSFNQQLLFKSLILSDTRNVLSALMQNSDTAIKRILNEWQFNKSILAKQYSLPLVARRKDLKGLETETEKLEKELNRRSSAFRDQQAVIEIRSATVQKNLQQDEVAVEFVRFHLYKNKKWTDSIIYAAYILTKNDSVPVFVPLFEEKQLQNILDSAGKTAAETVNNIYRGLEGKSKGAGALGAELYRLIWAPLEPHLKGINKISYSPAGKLYGIAFHALPVDSATILMDKYELQQYTSTRQVALRKIEKENSKIESITLFGDATFSMDSIQIMKSTARQENISTGIYSPPNRGTRGGVWEQLPGTAKEVEKIQNLFQQNKIETKTYTRIKASEENLKSLSGNSPQILHIATHGFFLPEPDQKRKKDPFSNENVYTLAGDPLLRSGLILAGGNYAWGGKTPLEGVEDGIATAYEISQLNLSNTELVVLSACETALGDVKDSEGVFGLQRAFKMAGVKKMIVSLWQVPDKETAELMTAFYDYWLKGKTIEEAFIQAQAEMRKKYPPFYWAAFVLIE